MYINSSDNPLETAATAFNEAMQGNGEKPILVLFSGGSSLHLLPLLDVDSFDNNVTITSLDDRYTFDEGVSNYEQITKTDFYKAIKDRGVAEIDTRSVVGESGKELALRVDTSLKAWLTTNPEGFVLATVGVGEDGHIAGMMPGIENPDFISDRLCVYYEFASSVNKYNQRITTTHTFLAKHINEAIVYAVGENKQEALESVLAREGDLVEVPARVLLLVPDVQLFTDVSV